MKQPVDKKGNKIVQFIKKHLLALILIISMVIRLGAALYLGDHVIELPGTYDQISYHTLATRLVEGHGFSFASDWWPATAAGEPTAHWSYLYTLYLAAVYTLVGIHPIVARVIQALIAGFLMPWLAYRITRKIFRTQPHQTQRRFGEEQLALLAAAWVALYGYFIYYAGTLMTETFFILCILWSLDCALRIFDQPLAVPAHQWIELGIATGSVILLRQLFLVFLPFLFLWLIWSRIRRHQELQRGRVMRLLAGLIISAIVVALLIAPFTVYNYQRFNRFVLLNTNAGYALFWSNHPIHERWFIPLFTPDMPSYQDLIPAELRHLNEADLESALMSQGIEFVVQDPVRFVQLSISRIPAYFIFWPLKESGILSNIVRVGSFGLSLPFMVLGIVLWIMGMRKLRTHDEDWKRVIAPGVLLLLFVFIYTGIHLVSWAGIRYRLPVDAVGLIFAAKGLETVLRRGAQIFQNRTRGKSLSA